MSYLEDYAEEYLEDIIQKEKENYNSYYMLNLQNPNLKDNQRDYILNRQYIVQKMNKICIRNNIGQKAQQAALMYLDIYMLQRNFNLQHYLFYICVSLLIANKYYGTYQFSLSQINAELSNKYSEQQIQDFEFDMLMCLKWKAAVVTGQEFSDFFLDHLDIDFSLYQMLSHELYYFQCIANPDFCGYKLSSIAFGSVFFALQSLSQKSEDFQIFNEKFEQLEQIVQEIGANQQQISQVYKYICDRVYQQEQQNQQYQQQQQSDDSANSETYSTAEDENIQQEEEQKQEQIQEQQQQEQQEESLESVEILDQVENLDQQQQQFQQKKLTKQNSCDMENDDSEMLGMSQKICYLSTQTSEVNVSQFEDEESAKCSFMFQGNLSGSLSKQMVQQQYEQQQQQDEFEYENNEDSLACYEECY